MGIGEKVEDFQYALEEKGIPKAALFIIAAIVIIAIAALVLLPLAAPENAEVRISVKTSGRQALGSQLVELSIDGKDLSAKTNPSGILTIPQVKMDSRISVSVKREGFEEFLENYTVSRKRFDIEVVLKKPAIPPISRVTITFARTDNSMLSGIPVTASFSCLNKAIEPAEKEKESDNGTMVVEIPTGCGTLFGDFAAPKFSQQSGIPLSTASAVVRFDEIEVLKGRVIVKALDSQENPIRETTLSITLFDSQGLKIREQQTSSGSAEFADVERKEYYAVITDALGKFESGQTEGKSLASEYISLTARLKRQTKGYITLKVIDSATSARVAGASVKISRSSKIAASINSDGNSDKNIALFEYGKYSLEAFQDDYLPLQQDFDFNANDAGKVVIARLEKCSDLLNNCGKLEVTVIDEEELPVENAEVSLYNAETKVLAVLEPKATDANGIAKFTNLRKGSYYIRAFKYPAEVRDETNVFAIDPKEPSKKTVTMAIGTGTFRIAVKDEEGEPVPDALIEFRTNTGKECPKAGGEKCTIQTDSRGIAEYTFKADKKVYAVITAEGFSGFVTDYRQVWKDNDETISIVLKRTIIGERPEFEIAGIYGLDGKTKRSELKAGERYIIRLRLEIPEGINPESAGFLLMAGSRDAGSIVENEPFYFRNIEIPEATVIKGTTWNPNQGQDIDTADDALTNSDFKWAEVSLKNPQSNTSYLVNAEIKVRNNVAAGRLLQFNYRAWAESGPGTYLREPEDERLGTAAESAGVQALYALLKEQPFYEGKSALCDDETGFCYYNERVYDEAERLNVTEPFGLEVFQTYLLTFELSNISQAVYGLENGARFDFLNSDNEGSTTGDSLMIIDYNFTNANGISTIASGASSFEIPEQAIQGFSENKSLKMSMRFQPKKEGSTSFFMRIISGSDIVYAREIQFSVNAENQLNVDIYPDFIGAFAVTDFNATITDDQGLEVQDALVKVLKITPDRAETQIGSKKTGLLGSAAFTAPSSSQGTKIRIIAEKEGYAGGELEVLVDENIVEFDPEELFAKLNLKSRTSREMDTEVQNRIPARLVLSKAYVSGNFQGYLDEELMNNYLEELAGYWEVGPNESKSIPVKFAVSAGIPIEEAKSVSGSVVLEFTSPDLYKKWTFKLPIKADISVGGDVDDSGCLNIGLKEWETMTQENMSTQEFTILNNCQVEGNDIPVKYLKARLKWQSNVMGNVQITIRDPETGSTASEILRDGEWVTLFDTLSHSRDVEYYSMISFQPTQGHLNEEAKFQVEFDAFTPTDSGLKNVGASNPIKAAILITTLTECIKFEPGNDTGIRIGRSEDEGSFTVSTADCGNVAVKLRFCQDSPSNNQCRGGTSSGGIEVSPWVTNSLKEGDKEIKVRRQSMDGIYGITVEARVPGRSWRKIATYDVVVEPKEGKYFTMDKYAFVLIGKGSKDSTVLFNEMLQEKVKVNTTTCDLAEAMSNPLFAGAAIGLASGVGGLLFSDISWTANVTTTNWVPTKAFTDVQVNGQSFTTVNSTTPVSGTSTGYNFATSPTQSGFVPANTPAGTVPDGSTVSNFNVTGAKPAGFGGLPVVSIVLGAAIGYATGGMQGAIIGAVAGAVSYYAAAACCAAGAAFPPVIGCFIWGAVCGAVAGAAVQYLGSMLMGSGEEKCDDASTSLVDYVINLKANENEERPIGSDAEGLKLGKYSGKISVEWNTDATDIYSDEGSASGSVQEAGIVFTNNGIEKQEPIYDIFTVSATEHIHGDILHEEAEVDCEDSDFGNFWIGENCGETTQNYSQQFHVRFKTMETKELIPRINFDTYDCSTNTLLGRSGEGALPQVKLDWSWAQDSGIDYDSCDAGNAQGVYCDAAQFSIAFTKRMQIFDDFMKKNDYLEGVCPSYEATDEDINSFSGFDKNAGNVDVNRIGVSNVSNSLDANNMTVIKVKVKNNTPEEVTVNFAGIAHGMDAEQLSGSCRIANLEIPANSEMQGTCPALLDAGTYIMSGSLTPVAGNTSQVDTSTKQFTIMVLALKTLPERALASQTGCDTYARTTDIATGEPMIMKFIDAAGSIQWTEKVPNKEALKELTHWDALLMKDAFTMDFRKDFVDYYTREGFVDAPQFFKDDTFGFKKYFLDENKMKFANRHFESEKIMSAGKYRVDIGAYYWDDWRLFDNAGGLKAAVGLTFYRISEPNPNSPFYSMPIDGMVGFKGSAFNRQGYGSQYENSSDIVIVDNSLQPAKTMPDAGSSASMKVKTYVEKNLKNLNNDLTRRGNLLSVQTTSNTLRDLEFSSNLATPVMMKASADEKTEEQYSVFYSLLENGTPVTVGSSLALWDAGANCNDFTGTTLTQAFNAKPDRIANQLDNITDYATSYAMDWPYVSYAGATYLRTIFYTPAKESENLKAIYPESALEFLTPDAQGSSISLNGISSLHRNNIDSAVGTIEDIFNLVKEGKVCVTNTGVRTRFWWNPKTIYEQVGNERSIAALSNSLEPGTDCIGESNAAGESAVARGSRAEGAE